MRIATWNIGEDERNIDGKLDINSYKYIVKMMLEENIEVICLQEAIIKSEYLPSIATYIKENTDLKYVIEYELSDSHINLGCKMGVVICSKYKIENFELFMLDNPKFIYSVDENTTYYSHDKGFIISKIKNYNLITGHCLPFHIFKKEPLDYIEIFNKADNKFSNYFNQGKTILCGDFNYDNIGKLFENSMKNATDLINESTRKDKQLDHFVISNDIKAISNNVLENYFDHKLGIFELDI